MITRQLGGGEGDLIEATETRNKDKKKNKGNIQYKESVRKPFLDFCVLLNRIIACVVVVGSLSSFPYPVLA